MIEDVDNLFKVFALGKPVAFSAMSLAPEVEDNIPSRFVWETPYLTHLIFNTYHTEHELLRYIKMMLETWLVFADLHPFAPTQQAQGYQEMFKNLGDMLCTLTGFVSFSLQPNVGAAGEYATGNHHRNVCIIHVSTRGTNPASVAMCGMKIITVGTDSKGNINIEEIRKDAEANKEYVYALMVSYPSTHGVYEEGIDEICKIILDNGGWFNKSRVEWCLTSPGWNGADVCHLNLHNTFCIPHGGGRPGMGPIGVKKHLAPYLPSHPMVATNP
uniref:Uncharacterized protein n=1 Tax=Lactuca sativa TaxID=4236 RepID=A0A9R1W8E7_LACSA|nr:hypothetical protein LSAT_V11C200065790 [Lactuca sativa]